MGIGEKKRRKKRKERREGRRVKARVREGRGRGESKSRSSRFRDGDGRKGRAVCSCPSLRQLCSAAGSGRAFPPGTSSPPFSFGAVIKPESADGEALAVPHVFLKLN